MTLINAIKEIRKIPIDVDGKQLLVVTVDKDTNGELVDKDMNAIATAVSEWLKKPDQPIFLINIKHGLSIELIPVRKRGKR